MVEWARKENIIEMTVISSKIVIFHHGDIDINCPKWTQVDWL